MLVLPVSFCQARQRREDERPGWQALLGPPPNLRDFPPTNGSGMRTLNPKPQTLNPKPELVSQKAGSCLPSRQWQRPWRRQQLRRADLRGRHLQGFRME